LLFAHLLELACAEHQRRKLTVDPDVYSFLERYPWPGNVRELRNVCEQLAIFGTDPVTLDQLPTAMLTARDAQQPATGLLRLADTSVTLPLRDFKEQCEREYIEAVLRRSNWNFTAAAQLLDIQRTYLHQKVVALGIERPQR
jgi:two-component system, NtrC family, nitrogen regulation response regulator NtrX